MRIMTEPGFINDCLLFGSRNKVYRVLGVLAWIYMAAAGFVLYLMIKGFEC